MVVGVKCRIDKTISSAKIKRNTVLNVGYSTHSLRGIEMVSIDTKALWIEMLKDKKAALEKLIKDAQSGLSNIEEDLKRAEDK